MHDVKALIGPIGLFSGLANRFPSAVVCPLVQGFALVPIMRPLAAELAVEFPFSPASVEHMPADMAPCVDVLAAELSMIDRIGYISTEFFGGDGAQDTVVWEQGKVTFALGDRPGSKCGWPNSAVSQALRKMGIAAEAGKDEFDTVGLGNHRSTERWAKAYAPA